MADCTSDRAKLCQNFLNIHKLNNCIENNIMCLRCAGPEWQTWSNTTRPCHLDDPHLTNTPHIPLSSLYPTPTPPLGLSLLPHPPQPQRVASPLATRSRNAPSTLQSIQSKLSRNPPFFAAILCQCFIFTSRVPPESSKWIA